MLALNNPNLFLIGFPKSGTTTIANVLAADPRIIVSNPKETFFHCRDIFSDDKAFNGTETDYLNLFCSKNIEIKYRCDATTLNVYSPNALKILPKKYPISKFILVTREPVSLINSWHKQLVAAGLQHEQSVDKAWQNSFKQYQKISFFLNYKEICKVSKYVGLWKSALEPSRLLLIDQIELIKNYKLFFNMIYSFLELPPPINIPIVSSDPSRIIEKHPKIKALIKRLLTHTGLLEKIRSYKIKNPESFLFNIENIFYRSPNLQYASKLTQLEILKEAANLT